MLISCSIAWRYYDVTICVIVKRDASGCRVNFPTFLNEKKKKHEFFQILIGAQLAYQINPMEFYKEWWNRNTVKLSFCKAAVPLVRFSIKDVQMTRKKQQQQQQQQKKKHIKKMAILSIFSIL